MQISDELRKLLVCEESDNYDEFTPAERSELVFHILKRITVGGSMCQYEDYFTPYLDVTRSVYRDMVAVQKNSTTKEIQVVSMAYQIEELDGTPLFPQKSQFAHNYCYVIIDPVKRHVTYWYQAHLPMW